ncbi:MAG: PIN-like domain-containing protein [Candidatus Obscuribacterales bacterium]
MKNNFPEDYSVESQERLLTALMKRKMLSQKARSIVSKRFYPSDADIESLWADCFFVFDANALTHLYQMQKDVRTRYLSIMEKFRERVWMPHQAASEYHQHLDDSLISAFPPLQALQDLRSKLKKEISNFSGGYSEWHWLKHAFTEIENELDKLVDSTMIERAERFDSCLALRERVAAIFDGRIGPPLSIEQRKDFVQDGIERLETLRPPACGEDAKKEANQFGDVIIWRQILTEATRLKKGFIFVTDDKKINWHYIDEIGLVGPRPELLLEAKRVANVTAWCYSSTAFMQRAQKILSMPKSVSIDTILKNSEAEEKELSKNWSRHFFTSYAVPDYLAGQRPDLSNVSNSMPTVHFWTDYSDHIETAKKLITDVQKQPQEIANLISQQDKIRDTLNELRVREALLKEAIKRASQPDLDL